MVTYAHDPVALFESLLISEDAFHRLEEELDWAELHASPNEQMELLDV